jgi:ribosomal protein S19
MSVQFQALRHVRAAQDKQVVKENSRSILDVARMIGTWIPVAKREFVRLDIWRA